MDGLLDLARAVAGRCTVVLQEPEADLPGLGQDLRTFLEPARSLLEGGKRMRAQLCAVGWQAAGGAPDAPAIIHAGCALELFQAAALVHDDVIDDAGTRRGRPASHVRFAALHPAGGDAAAAFGTHAAILLGDLLLVLAHREWRRASTGAPDAAADEIWDLMTAEVAIGQYLDVHASILPIEHGDRALARALHVVRHKSARYSVEHPLVLGAALGGADPEMRAALARVGLPLGEAFQLRDDDLGIFGDPARTGKPAGDDLLEGKRTPLILYGLQMCEPGDAALIRNSLGTRPLEDAVVQRIRAALVGSGAVERHERLIATKHDEALRAIAAPAVPAHVAGILRDLAAALTLRDA